MMMISNLMMIPRKSGSALGKLVSSLEKWLMPQIELKMMIPKNFLMMLLAPKLMRVLWLNSGKQCTQHFSEALAEQTRVFDVASPSAPSLPS
jgi:hypothetical protein